MNKKRKRRTRRKRKKQEEQEQEQQQQQQQQLQDADDAAVTEAGQVKTAQPSSHVEAAGRVVGCRKKKTRTVFSRAQILQLESTFDAKRYLSSAERSSLASALRLTETQVNARAIALNHYYYFPLPNIYKSVRFHKKWILDSTNLHIQA